MTDVNHAQDAPIQPYPQPPYQQAYGEQAYAPQPYAQQPYGQPYPPQAQPFAVPPTRKRRRIFLWFFLAIQALFLIWIIAGIGSASGDPSDCGSLSKETCNNAEAVGTGIGVVLVVGLWMVVDFLLGVGYAIYRLAKRP